MVYPMSPKANKQRAVLLLQEEKLLKQFYFIFFQMLRRGFPLSTPNKNQYHITPTFV